MLPTDLDAAAVLRATEEGRWEVEAVHAPGSSHGAAWVTGIYTNTANFGADMKLLPKYERMKADWQAEYKDVSDLDYVA